MKECNYKTKLKKTRALPAAILSCIVLVMAAGTVYAFTQAGIKFTNLIETGSVGIQIEQPSADNEADFINRISTVSVLPNQNVKLETGVRNTGAPGYARIKAEMMIKNTGDGEVDEKTHNTGEKNNAGETEAGEKEAIRQSAGRAISLNDLSGVGEGWVERGGYFYYTKTMAPGEYSKLFSSIHIPEDLPDGTETIKLNFTADVIQSANFKPNFDSSSPWGSVVIEKRKDDITGIEYGKATAESTDHVMSYSGNGEIQCTGTDLFRNWDPFMAGSEFSDTLSIKNDSDENVNVYFRTNNGGSEDSKLLSAASLMISYGDREIINDDLLSLSNSDYILLGSLKSGDLGEMHYTVSMPAESDNEYEELKDSVMWQFKIVGSGGGSISSAVKTGDEFSRVTAVLVIMALIILIVSIAWRRGGYTGRSRSMFKR